MNKSKIGYLFATVLLFGLLGQLSAQAEITAQSPAPNVTPGVLCSRSDTDFSGLDYPEKIARCNRNIGEQEKAAVAAEYGNIPKSNWTQFEFDHLIPLCAGGSNNIKNLWPQPLAEAKKKDVVEVDICLAMKAGTMTQAVAVQKIYEWFQANPALEEASAHFDQLFFRLPKVICAESVMSNKKRLGVVFDFNSGAEIKDVVISSTEDAKTSDVETSEGKVIRGQTTRATSGPLSGYTLYVLGDKRDRFDLYLPAAASGAKAYRGYLKISFEDTLPRLVSLDCRTY